MLVLLIAAAAFIWLRNFKLIDSATEFEEEKTAEYSTEKIGTISVSEKFIYDKSGRDPFYASIFYRAPVKKTTKSRTRKRQQKQKEEAKLPKISIDGLMWDDSNPVAVLKDGKSGDTKIVQKGDSVFGVRILRILPDSVRVKFEKKTYYVK